MRDWKTSLVGCAIIFTAVVAVAVGVMDRATGGALLAAGVGFIVAKDSKGRG